MRILFWNLNGKNNTNRIKSILMERDIDIAVFSEYKKSFIETAVFQEIGYKVIEGYGGCEKIIFLVKKDIEVFVCKEQHRYAICIIRLNNKCFILSGVHLHDNIHYGPRDRARVISQMVHDIKDVESEYDTLNTIVIGDFNCSPFDDEMIEKDLFNSVLFKKIIEKSEYVKYDNTMYRRFYNPMLEMVSEHNNQYGSCYYNLSRISELYWYSYDQVIVRKSLIDCITDLEWCNSIDSINLLTKAGYPNKMISDHLPLFMEVLL